MLQAVSMIHMQCVTEYGKSNEVIIQKDNSKSLILEI